MGIRNNEAFIMILFFYTSFYTNTFQVSSPVHSSHSEFTSVVTTRAFVDKTLMIKALFEMPEYCMITVPRRFGKTTNIDMVKKFLEIETDAYGEPVTSARGSNQPVVDTPNYELFVGHNLKITWYRHLMYTHFGKYPVIVANFRTFRTVRSFDDAISLCRNVIHKSYLAHKYLMNSRHLDDEDKEMCRIWCSVIKYTTLDIAYVTEGLHRLSTFLQQHHNGHKCFVLIDEYDEILTKLSLDNDKELRNIVSLVADTIYNVVINNCHVARGVITGLSYITGGGISPSNNIYSFKFLENHPFVEYFGFTKREVDQLLSRNDFGLDWKTIESGLAMYDGYLSKSGVKIYNVNSILWFLQTKEVRPHWSNFGNIEHLGNAFVVPKIKKLVMELLLNKTIFIEVKEKLTLSEVVQFRRFIEKPDHEGQITTDLFFSFILENGYLTYAAEQRMLNRMPVRIPNAEVLEEVLLQVEEYYTNVCGFDKEVMKECSRFFDNLSPFSTNKDPYFIKLLIKFYKTLKVLFQGFSRNNFVKLTENELHIFITVLLHKTQYQFVTEYRYVYMTGKRFKIIRPDLILWKNNFAIILEFKHKISSASCSRSGLQQIVNREYYKIFNSEKFSHINITHYIFIGLAIDNDFKPYISCLPNTLDLRKAVHLYPGKRYQVPKKLFRRPRKKRLNKSVRKAKKKYRLKRVTSKSDMTTSGSQQV